MVDLGPQRATTCATPSNSAARCADRAALATFGRAIAEALDDLSDLERMADWWGTEKSPFLIGKPSINSHLVGLMWGNDG